MNAKQAREALLPTLEDIAEVLRAAGLTATVRTSFSDVDMLDHEDMMQNSALLYGEILFGAGDGEGMALECAVSINEGQVADEEFLSEISSLRTEAKRIAGIATAVGKEGLFDELECLSDEDEADTDTASISIDDYIKDDWTGAPERDTDTAADTNMIGHLPLIIGIGAVIAVIIMIIALL